jgi:hypothetical protein
MSRVVGRLFGKLGAVLGILSEVIRLFHSFLLCKALRRWGRVYNAVSGDTFSMLMNGCSDGLQLRVVKLGWEKIGGELDEQACSK